MRGYRSRQGKGLGLGRTIGNKVVDVASDIMSYPARRNAQKSILNSDKQYNDIKQARTTFKEPIKNPSKPAQVKAIPQTSQRDQYNKAMTSAMKKGGSNGVGIGY